MGDNQETAKKLVVNASCIGCGACTAIASEIFELNDE
jgi:ferredoxin